MIVMFTSPAYSAVRGNNAPSKKYPEACRRLETSNVLSAAPAPKCKAHNSVFFFLFFRYDFVRPHTSCFTLLHTHARKMQELTGKCSSGAGIWQRPEVTPGLLVSSYFWGDGEAGETRGRMLIEMEPPYHLE